MALLLCGVDMELCELKVFLTVATERSFSRAAAKLYRTQPAVSQAIRRLEQQLGECLFDRTTKQATLTEAGAVLLREGTRLLRLAEEAKAAVKRQSEKGRAVLRIAGSELAAHVVLPAISTFVRQHEGLSVDFHRLSEAHVLAEVTAGTFDIGVVADERVPGQLQQVRIRVQATGFSAIVPRNHRLAARPGAAINALDHERVIVVTDPEMSERLTAALADAAVEPVSVMGMPGIDSLKRAVDMGLGVGIVPSSVASAVHLQRPLVVVPLASTSFLNSVTIIYRRDDSQSRNTARFIEIVRRSQTPTVTSTEEVRDVRRAAARI